ncbi:MAG: single-stranded DNA-binding protein [Romboutsia sp.]|uniref:single-stranded DNA-binding protein n=1 Tax=Romboutsia sp. TaxID=1965302 RepID=UPI003F2B14E3
MNNVVLVGRLTRDAEIKYVGASNIPLATFTIAIDRKVFSKNTENKTDFLDVELWDRKAENMIGYLKKGNMVGINGEIRIEKYQDSNGQNKYSTKIRANTVNLISQVRNRYDESSSSNNKYYDGSKVFEQAGVNIEMAEEELPF